MKKYDFFIIGGGMTAHAAGNAILTNNPDAVVGLTTKEQYAPYWRPPLSKSLWQNKNIDDIWCGTSGRNLDILQNTEIVEIDAEQKNVRDQAGTTYQWDKLLLATGGEPKQLPFDANNEIIYYRTLDDYNRLREKIKDKIYPDVLAIGGGFIGSEIAAALAMNEVNVTMIFPEKGIGGSLFPEELGKFLKQYYREKGIRILAENTVAQIENENNTISATTADGKKMQFDAVVAGIGIQPATDLAQKAGLKVSDGIHVDQYLRTDNPDIFAAGDVARFYNPLLDKYIRVEHDDNTQTMGETAGKNMTGEENEYNYLPMFYSDLFDLGYEAVGETRADLETVSEWEDFGRKGIVFYLSESQVRGIIFWNVWDQVDAGRELIGRREAVSEQFLSQWAEKCWS